jgi:hypothetical protein
MSFSFDAPLWKWQGEMGWYFVNVPKEYFSRIRTQYGKGLLRVRVTIGQSIWETSLLPHNVSGTYLIAIKASIRKAEGLFEGDKVNVCIEFLKATKV